MNTGNQLSILNMKRVRIALLGFVVLSVVSLSTLLILERHSRSTTSEEASKYRRLVPLQKLDKYANSKGTYKDPVLQTNGYIIIRIHRGFHDVRYLICNISVARLLNGSLIMEFHLKTRGKRISFRNFAYLHIEKQFVLPLTKDARVSKAIPENIKRPRGKKALHLTSSDFYMCYDLPSLEKHSAVELVVIGRGSLQVGILRGSLRYALDTLIHVSGVNVIGGRKMLSSLHAIFDNVVGKASLRNFRELTGINIASQPLLNEEKRKQEAWERLGPCPHPHPLPCARPEYPYEMGCWWFWFAKKGNELASNLAMLRENAHTLLQETNDYVVYIKTNLFIPTFDFFASLVIGERLYESPASKTFKPESSLAPALYVFGDSLSDSGNNNFLQTHAKVNYIPYGIDFPSGVTGRFTNGKTFVDFIAEFLGLPYAPPYMGLSKNDKINITTGVNYASGSAGILPETGTVHGENLSFDKQINFFHNTITNDLPNLFATPSKLSNYLSNSILVVSIGNNDYINNYLHSSNYYNTSRLYTPQEFADLLVDKLSQGLKKLYSLGGRKFLVFNIGKIGCIPNIVNKIYPKPITPCVEDINDLVLLFNARVPSMIKKLEFSLVESSFVQGDSYRATSGLSLVESSCCEIDNGGLCVEDGVPCEDRDGYRYWDAFHPTEVVYHRLARDCFGGSSSCVPINVEQLARK